VTNGYVSRVRLFASIPANADFALVDKVTVLAFPGHVLCNTSSYRKKIIMLNLISLKTQKFPPLTTKMRAPRVIVVKGNVYVFGGFTKSTTLKTCAKANLQPGPWSRLPDLPRTTEISTYLTPVCLDNLIYLPDVRGHLVLFDIEAEAFKQVQVGLTPDWCLLAIPFEEYLYLVSYSGEVRKWALRTGEISREEGVAPVCYTTFPWHLFSVRVGRSVYWFTMLSPELYCFDTQNNCWSSQSSIDTYYDTS
jgi:hypothetical protein